LDMVLFRPNQATEDIRKNFQVKNNLQKYVLKVFFELKKL